jgi:cytoskeletal protein RodZ
MGRPAPETQNPNAVDEIGQVLREAREARGLTLAEVHSELRIGENFLQALEEGFYDALPTPVHLRGYLRNYARFLDLDPAPLLDRLVQTNGYRPVVPSSLKMRRKLDVPEQLENHADSPVGNPNGTFFDPVNAELQPAGESQIESILRVVLIIALLVTIGLVGSRFLNDGRQIDVVDAVRSVLVSEPESAADDAETDALESVIDSSPIVPTGRNTVSSAADQGPGVSQPTERPALPDDMSVIDLRVEVTRRTWLQLDIDGNTEFQGIARQGDVFELTAETSATLNTGSGADVYVTINGIELGRLGERNQVIEETWETSQ